MQVNAYAAQSAEADLAPLSIERRAPRPGDVSIAIRYCGVCHSDLHTARADWGQPKYPVVPGHEIVGRVTAVGEGVTRFKPGDSVAVGCMVDSCRECHSCARGLEQFCENVATFTYNSIDKHDQTTTYGGYSAAIVVAQDFVLRLPDGLDMAGAAPLLCAGITLWSPLRHWGAGPGKRVAIVGLGGLGHMGVKLAHALGAEVTLITRSPGKEADARRLGADHVILSTDNAQMEAAKRGFDLIIDTVPNVHDLNPYVPLLDIAGSLVLVGYLGDLDPMLNTVPLIMGRRSVAGSLIGGIAETQELLDFCGAHGIVSDIEVIPMQEINAAWERMQQSDVKYRFVIDMASLGV